MKGLQRVGKIETCDLAYWYKNLDVVLLARIELTSQSFVYFSMVWNFSEITSIDLT